MDIQQQLLALQRRIDAFEKHIERSKAHAEHVAEAQFICAQCGLNWSFVTRRRSTVNDMRLKLVKRLLDLGWTHAQIANSLGVSSRTIDRDCGKKDRHLKRNVAT